MRLGLWVAPETGDPDGDLRRARPDCTLGRAAQSMGRRRFSLGLSRNDLRAHLVATPDPAGLDPARRHTATLREPAAPPRALNRFGHALERPVTRGGAALTGGALRPPALFPETMLVLEGRAA